MAPTTTGHGKGMPTASLFESGRLLLLVLFVFSHNPEKPGSRIVVPFSRRWWE